MRKSAAAVVAVAAVDIVAFVCSPSDAKGAKFRAGVVKFQKSVVDSALAAASAAIRSGAEGSGELAVARDAQRLLDVLVKLDGQIVA